MYLNTEVLVVLHLKRVIFKTNVFKQAQNVLKQTVMNNILPQYNKFVSESKHLLSGNYILLDFLYKKLPKRFCMMRCVYLEPTKSNQFGIKHCFSLVTIFDSKTNIFYHLEPINNLNKSTECNQFLVKIYKPNSPNLQLDLGCVNLHNSINMIKKLVDAQIYNDDNWCDLRDLELCKIKPLGPDLLTQLPAIKIISIKTAIRLTRKSAKENIQYMCIIKNYPSLFNIIRNGEIYDCVYTSTCFLFYNQKSRISQPLDLDKTFAVPLLSLQDQCMFTIVENKSVDYTVLPNTIVKKLDNLT